MYSAGLVLEGGGLRCAYESGVLDAFMENGITFPYVIGVSAGSCNGVSFIAKNLYRMRDIMVDYAHDKRYMGVKSVFENGEFLNTKWIFGELSYQMFPLNYDEFEKAAVNFVLWQLMRQQAERNIFIRLNFVTDVMKFTHLVRSRLFQSRF